MHFEDLNVWKRSSQLSIEVIKQFSICNDSAFKSEITRCCLAVPGNIAEGFDRGTEKYCTTFFFHAKGSCAQLQTYIHIGIQLGYISQENGSIWNQEANKISQMLSTLISSRSH